MIFLVTAFLLSRKARWSAPFTIVTLICGTIPLVSFWAEVRATRNVKAQLAAEPVTAGR
jgi:integral membrane protein